MGIGNFFWRNADTVYVDHEEVYGEYDIHTGRFSGIEYEDDYYFRFQDFIENIITVLPKSFRKICSEDRRKYEPGTAIAENGFFVVTIVEWENYFAVNIVLKKADTERNPWEYNPLGEYLRKNTREKIFGELNEIYKLYVRTSAGTSSPCNDSKPLYRGFFINYQACFF